MVKTTVPPPPHLQVRPPNVPFERDVQLARECLGIVDRLIYLFTGDDRYTPEGLARYWQLQRQKMWRANEHKGKPRES